MRRQATRDVKLFGSYDIVADADIDEPRYHAWRVPSRLAGCNVSHVVGNWLAGPVRALTTDYAISTGRAGREAEIFSYQLTIGFAGLITVPALLLLIRVSTSEVDAAAGRQVGDEEGDTSHDELSDAPSGYEDGQMDPIE